MQELTARETRNRLRDLHIETSPVEAFALGGGGRQKVTFDWHSHSRHQLIYAFEGTLAVEAAGRRNLLPTQRAALIPAGLRHRTIQGSGSPSRTASIFLAPKLAKLRPDGIAVFNSSPLLREMMTHGLRWGPDHQPTPVSRQFFRTVALLCSEWIAEPVPFWLPVAEEPRVQKALRFADAHLHDANETSAASACGMSERSFRRHFPAATGLSWREYITRARMLRAADKLAASRETIAQTAWDVGYQSPAAFAKAFEEFSGQTPGQYRRERR